MKYLLLYVQYSKSRQNNFYYHQPIKQKHEERGLKEGYPILGCCSFKIKKNPLHRASQDYNLISSYSSYTFSGMTSLISYYVLCGVHVPQNFSGGKIQFRYVTQPQIIQR